MIIAPPYWPRKGEWERLSNTFPNDHPFIVVENDHGVDSAATVNEAKTKLETRRSQHAVIVQKLEGPLPMLMIWR